MAAEVRIEAERVEDVAVPGRAIVAVGFAEWGRPTVLLTDEEHAEVPFGREERGGSFPLRRAARPWPATIVTADAARIDVGPLDMTFPIVQAMPDGGAVVVACRCRTGDANVLAVDRDGAVRRRFAAGDGIEWAQTSAHGDLWVGWFDEGVFGDAPNSLSIHGVARFGPDGEVRYRYEPPSGVTPIADCYALNVAEDATWACTYPDFPLVRIRPDGVVRAWHEAVPGATALAVHQSRVLIFGGYGARRRDVHLGALGRAELTGLRPVRIVDDRGAPLEPDRAEGRGRHLHLLCGSTWWRVDLATVPA